MTDRRYRLMVYKPGSTSLSTGNVDFIVGSSALIEAPVVSGGRARLLEGRMEAVPTALRLLDSTNGGWTSHLSSNGRNTGLNRFVQVQRSDAGGAYAAIGGGRVTDVTYSENLAEVQVTLNPEWPTGANTLCFTTNTTHLYPPCPDPGGQRIGFYGFPYRYGYATVVRTETSFGPVPRTQAKRFYTVTFRPDNPPMPTASFGAIQGDVATFSSVAKSIYSTNGAFKYLKFNVNGVDYPVVSFAMDALPGTYAEYYPNSLGPLPSDQTISDHQTKGAPLRFIIAATSTAFGTAASTVDNLAVGKAYAYDHGNPFLHMMGAPASDATPLHIFAVNNSTGGTAILGGVHPMQVLKDLLAGSYSHSTVPYQLPLYSTVMFTGGSDLRKLPMPLQAFRITAPAPMQTWIQDNLCAPFGVLPTMDPTGVVRFKNFRIPGGSTGSSGFSTGTLFGFTSTNLAAPHPDWRLNRNEACTVANITVNTIQQQLINAAPGGGPPNLGVGGDGLLARSRTTSFYHDRYLQLGAYPADFQYTGIVLDDGYQQNWYPVAKFAGSKGALTYLAQEVFGRFGDGPVQGTLRALENAATVAPGDITALKLPTYPNYGTNARGGTRLVQILSKTVHPDGYEFDYLDAGPAQPASTKPTFSLAVSTRTPKSGLKATVSAVPSNAWFTISLANSSAATAPSVSSPLWHPVYSKRGNGTFELNHLPSGQFFYGRCQTRQSSGRPLSDYAVSSRVATSAISAPTALKTSNIKNTIATSTWKVGDVNYPLQLYVDESTSATPSTGNLYRKLAPGTQITTLDGLTANHTHKVMARHYDAYGGVSATISSAFTTPSTAVAPNIILPPPMAGMFAIVGST